MGPAVFKTVVRHAECLGCVRFAHVPANSGRMYQEDRAFDTSRCIKSPVLLIHPYRVKSEMACMYSAVRTVHFESVEYMSPNADRQDVLEY